MRKGISRYGESTGSATEVPRAHYRTPRLQGDAGQLCVMTDAILRRRDPAAAELKELATTAKGRVRARPPALSRERTGRRRAGEPGTDKPQYHIRSSGRGIRSHGHERGIAA